MSKAQEIKQDFFLRKQLFKHEPQSKGELWKWAKLYLRLDLTREHVCPDHHSQIDWFWHSTREMGDSYVLACRNGGKTSLGGAATVYDAEYKSPCSTIIVGGCLHPQTPVLTNRGFKKIPEVTTSDEVYDGLEWRRVKGKGSRLATPHLKLSFIGLPPLYLTAKHRVIRVEGIECPLADSKSMRSPRVCPPKVNCAYHRRRFHCEGRGEVGEVEARNLRVGDALVYPLSYLNPQGTTASPTAPFLQGILYGSLKEVKNGYLEIRKPYSQSREYDRFVLDQIRNAIGTELSIRPLSQHSSGDSFVLRYDSHFFNHLNLNGFPRDLFSWDRSAQTKFATGVLNGSRFCIYNAPAEVKAFSSRRDDSFALNLFALLANAQPRLDSDSERDMRVTFASTSVKKIKNIVPARLCLADPVKERATTQPKLRFHKWGQALCMQIKEIEECPPSENFWDLEIDGGERFLTLWGLAHNSKRQSERMYSYTKPIFQSGSRGVLQDEVDGPVGREFTRLKNGSTIEIVASTELSVGGFHQDRIRVDQVDDMKPAVWNTLQFDINFASESAVQVETFGTWDRVGGLYEKVLQTAKKRGKPIFQWCLLDVIEPCKDRKCFNCDLSDVCGGIAKDKKEGFLKIDKAIETRRRLISDDFFMVQMMLKQPRPLDAIIPDFHDGNPFVKQLSYNPSLPTYRTFDWGTRGNFVCLWIQIDEKEDRLYVIDEYVGGRGAFPSREAKAVLAYEGRKGYKNIYGSYGDPRGPAWIREFQLYGIYVIPLVRKKPERLALLGKLLSIRGDKKPSIIISYKCRTLRIQLLSYDTRCLFDQRGAPADDAVDSLLYGINGLRGRLRLHDAAPLGVIALSEEKKKEQQRARKEFAKFSPEFAEELELKKGKTDYRKFLP